MAAKGKVQAQKHATPRARSLHQSASGSSISFHFVTTRKFTLIYVYSRICSTYVLFAESKNLRLLDIVKHGDVDLFDQFLEVQITFLDVCVNTLN